MLRNSKIYGAAGIGVATLLAAACSLPIQARSLKAKTLSSGTVLAVKLNESLSSKTLHKGDTFSSTVTAPTVKGASNPLPEGTTVSGVVRDVQAMEDKEPGMLDLSFNRITLPNGRSYSISGSSIALDNKSVTTKNGRMVAKNQRGGPSRLTYVGIGAGAGLLVNILTHRKGTLMDTLIGAGLGYGAGSLIKGKTEVRDVELKEGTQLGVRLDRSVTVSL